MKILSQLSDMVANLQVKRNREKTNKLVTIVNRQTRVPAR